MRTAMTTPFVGTATLLISTPHTWTSTTSWAGPFTSPEIPKQRTKEWQTWADTTTDRAEGKQMGEALKLWKRAGPEAFFRFRATSQIKHSETEYVPPYFIAYLYASAGDADAAFQWLQKAIDEPDNFVLYLRIDPAFDKLHSDPRYQQLLKRLKLDR